MLTRSDCGIREYTEMKRTQTPLMARTQIEFEAVEIISRFNIRLYALCNAVCRTAADVMERFIFRRSVRAQDHPLEAAPISRLIAVASLRTSRETSVLQALITGLVEIGDRNEEPLNGVSFRLSIKMRQRV